MKVNIILLCFFSTLSQAACDAYIDNEWPDSRYFVENISNDYVVSDTVTGLMWKRCLEGRWGASCQNGSNTNFSWQVALNFALTEDYAGYTDWRVPNIHELDSLSAKNCYSPAINETAFPNTVYSNSRYWSSSPTVFSDTQNWTVHFGYGTHDIRDRDELNLLRMVRSTQ